MRRNKITVIVLAIFGLLGGFAPTFGIQHTVLNTEMFDLQGFIFSDFNNVPESGPITFSINHAERMFEINVNADIDLDGTVGGGLGSNVALTDFDADTAQIEVTLRVNPLNTVSTFSVSLVDLDDEMSGDVFVFTFDLSLATPGELVTLVQPLTTPGPASTDVPSGLEPGDALQNYGLSQISLQAFGDPLDRVIIDLKSIKIIDPSDPTLLRMTSQDFRDQIGNFVFGAFDAPDTFDITGSTIVLDVRPIEGEPIPEGNAFGGLGAPFFGDFGADASIEVDVKLGANNQASAFGISITDRDGDDSGPGLGAETFSYAFPLTGVTSEEFTTLSVPVSQFGFTGPALDFTYGGDGVPNPDLREIVILSEFGSSNRLNIEIGEIRIVPMVPPMAGR